MKFDPKRIEAELRREGILPEDDTPPGGPAHGGNGHPHAGAATSAPADAAPVRRKANPLNAAAGGEHDNDTLILTSGSVPRIDSAARLFSGLAKTYEFFRKGSAVFSRLDGVEYRIKLPGKHTVQDALMRVESGELRSEMERYFTLWVWGVAGRVPALKRAECDEDEARALLKTREVYLLPPINTTPGAPIAIEGKDGELEVLQRGYHDFNGGTLVLNHVSIPVVPLEKAVETINDMFSEFDFQTPSDRSRAIANLLSPALSMGQLIDGWVPIDIAEADLSQSGKGMRQRMTQAIYHETTYVIARNAGGVGSLDESLSKALLSGRPFVQFDNVRADFDSQKLESAITEGVALARIPYRGEVEVMTKGFVFMITSNGLNTTPDLTNRACIVRIRNREGYPWKDYPNGKKLEAHVSDNRDFYLGCIFSVIREWLRQGKPKNVEELRHYARDWAQSVDWIVRNLFKAPAPMDGHQLAQKRASSPSLNFVRALCLAAEKDSRMGETWKANDFAALATSHGIAIPGHRSQNEEDGMRQVGIQMSQALGKNDELELEGFRVVRTVSRESRGDGNGCRDVKTYLVEKAGGSL